ncbi:ankyrin repeat and protein kinase domain-containing protein [Colletotrichum truncatum]|uniref:Ankyrin repeat and protein kinase domain-containing protein n=1 Tax=Colletotrichum truncatum TaxID=5467 RepID=A0ACC3YDJ1_COLTU
MERDSLASEDQGRAQEAPQPEQLLEAAAAHNTEALESLVAHLEGGIDMPNSEGFTALHLAVLRRNVAAVEVLLSNGADVEATAPNDRRPLHMAVDERSSDIVQLLLSHNTVPDAKAQGLAPLHSALLHADVDITRLLLEFGADIKAWTDDGREPLFLAVDGGNASIVKLLLDSRADPNTIYTECPRTALHLACDRGNPGIVKTLLEYGANANALIDANEGTPLFYAVASGSTETVKLLLQGGAKTHIWRSDGQSVLDLAEDNEEMLKLLEGQRILKGPRIRGFDVEGGSEQPFTVLRPHPAPTEGDRNKVDACHGFDAFIIDFFTEGEHEQFIPQTVSVYELLYSDGPELIKRHLEDGSEPSFTWYHLPSNNMVWIESLIRRLAAEKGNVSAEVYDSAKVDLELSASEPNAKPKSFAASFSAMRPHCRRVPGHSISPLTDGRDGIVSFEVPFLHFESYSGYEAMNTALKKRLVERPRRPILEVPRPPTPLLNTGGRDASPTVKNQRRPTVEPHLSTSDDLAGSSNISIDNASERGFGSRLKATLKSLNDRISNWGWQKPHHNSRSATDMDLESGSRNSDNNHDQLEMEATTEPRVENEQTHPTMKNEPQSAMQQIAPNNGSVTASQEIHDTAEAIDLPPVRGPPLDSASDGLTRTEHAGAHDSGHSTPTRLMPFEIGFHGQDPGLSGKFDSNEAHEQSRPESTKISQVLKKHKKKKHRHPLPPQNLHEYLIRGYLSPGKQGFQPRRTLDQYVYGHIETTSHRDDDQVVYRYTSSQLLPDPKIIMVDQLWLWVLGDGITSYDLGKFLKTKA